MIKIPDSGIKLAVSGPGKRTKVLNVTPAHRCQDWIAYKLGPQGHQTLEVAGVADCAAGLGYTSVALADAPAPDAGDLES